MARTHHRLTKRRAKKTARVKPTAPAATTPEPVVAASALSTTAKWLAAVAVVLLLGLVGFLVYWFGFAQSTSSPGTQVAAEIKKKGCGCGSVPKVFQ